MLVIVSLAVSLIAIAVLSVFMVISIERVSVEVRENAKRNVQKMLDEYDEVINEKRSELTELEKQISFNNAKVINSNETNKQKNNETPYQEIELSLSDQKGSSAADIYKTIRNNYDINLTKVAKTLITQAPKADKKTELMQSILKKISPEQFLQLDSLGTSKQKDLLKSVLTKEEFELVDKLDVWGIDLYDVLRERVELKKDYRSVVVANERIKQQLEKKGVNSTLSDDLVEGMTVTINDRVFEYGINRKELQK